MPGDARPSVEWRASGAFTTRIVIQIRRKRVGPDHPTERLFRFFNRWLVKMAASQTSNEQASLDAPASVTRQATRSGREVRAACLRHVKEVSADKQTGAPSEQRAGTF